MFIDFLVMLWCLTLFVCIFLFIAHAIKLPSYEKETKKNFSDLYDEIMSEKSIFTYFGGNDISSYILKKKFELTENDEHIRKGWTLYKIYLSYIILYPVFFILTITMLYFL